MSRWSLALFMGLFSLVPVSSQASRAELDGRGFPYLLAIDPSNVVLFPGSATMFSQSALVDYYPYTSSDSPTDIYYLPDALRYVGPFVDPVKAVPQRFVLGLTGKHLTFGYVMDGKSHNLILSHASGLGLSVGIEDKYDLSDRYDQETDLPYSSARRGSLEISRRDLRLGLGWSSGNASRRIFEVGVTADVVYMQYDVSQIFANIDTAVISDAAWKSEPGLGFDVRLRTLSPVSGLQGAFRFAYEDLQPNVMSGPATSWIRRYGLAELGWRFQLKELDDFVAGIVLECSEDSFSGPEGGGYYSLGFVDNQMTQYYGQVFASAERHIVQRLVGRAGVRGSVFFNEQNNLELTNNLGSTRKEIVHRSQGGISDPEFFLGAGWSWKRFQMDGRLRENIDLDNPVLQWSVGYSW